MRRCRYRHRLAKNLEYSVTPFWHEYDDIATFSLSWPGPGLINVKNKARGAASLMGVESEVRYRVTPQVTLLGNYTYQHFDWRCSRNFADTDLMTPPRHKFMIGARWSPTDDLHLSSHLYVTDEVIAPDPNLLIVPKTIDAYCRLDLRAEYEFWEDRAAVGVGVQNLLDNDHPEATSRFLIPAEIPRMVYAELRVTFK